MKNKLILIASVISLFSCNDIKNKIGLGNSTIETKNSVLVCDYDQLSNQFNIKFVINHDSSKTSDVVDYNLQITDKSGKELTALVVRPKIASSDVVTFSNCDFIKSLTTKHNLRKNFQMDLFDGNIVVGDYNFDGFDDIAIYSRKDIANNKIYYDYYLRTDGGQYVKNDFLSNDTDYFGKKYDLKNKSIVIDNQETISKYSFQDGGFIKTLEETKIEKVETVYAEHDTIATYSNSYANSSSNHQSKMDYFIDDFYGYVETKGDIVMNVRNYADKDANLITQLQPYTAYKLNFSGSRIGQWAHVNAILMYDNYYSEFYATGYSGWIKIVSDNGDLNFKLVKQ